MQNSLLHRPRYCTYSFIQFKPVPAVLRRAKPLSPPLSQSLRSSACTRTAKIISPSTTVFLSPPHHQKFLYFYCFRQSGKVIQRKSTPSLGLPGWARSATARAHTRTDTHVHTHPGLCPASLLPHPVPQELHEGPRDPTGMDGSIQKAAAEAVGLWFAVLGYKR